ncbi:MAG: carboxylating nicotinate-nucleotide diphosphorylase [Candidatus Synoicihabitans palmerolidicus]|nr:carboxylating nicotinate-nucleotide diphosphorylase [Candidatus Synoicihabitans palmerolidicus]
MSSALSDSLLHRLTWEDLDLTHVRRLIDMARDEDLAGLGLRQPPRMPGDHSTGCLDAPPRTASAHLVARHDITVCGLPLLSLILSAYRDQASVQLRTRDGAHLRRSDTLATFTGDPRTLLTAERIVLNFLQRLSGIATLTQRYVQALGEGRTRLLDTRKTTPGYRMLEKYAVACGGGWNHRLGLFDRVMLKDNHLALLGSTHDLAAAIDRARRHAPLLPVEVEVDRLDQIPPVLEAGTDVILLDNFPPARLRRALDLINGRALTEASGGITLAKLPHLAGLGLDFISTGALMHQSSWVDIGLDWNA